MQQDHVQVEHVIPASERPGWWPTRDDILVNDKEAIMSEAAFTHLPDYTFTDPTEAWAGKMWKRHARLPTRWLLCWFKIEGDHYEIDSREIVLMDWQTLMGVREGSLIDQARISDGAITSAKVQGYTP